MDILRNEIQHGRPVYLKGKNSNGDGHAWVCEGYQHQKYSAVISMIADRIYALPNPGSKYYDYTLFINPVNAKDDTSTREYFYMNWGQYGSNNGWYRANGYSSNTNYTINQKTLTVSK